MQLFDFLIGMSEMKCVIFVKNSVILFLVYNRVCLDSLSRP